MNGHVQRSGSGAPVLDPRGQPALHGAWPLDAAADVAQPLLDTRADASPVDLFGLMPTAQRSYPKGVELLHDDTVPPVVAMLRRGLVKVVRVSASGREYILALHPAPVLIGAAEAVIGQPLVAAVVTATTCEVDEMPTDRFLALIRARADVLWSLQQQLAWEACALRARTVEVCTLSPRERLQCTLAQFVPVGNDRLRDVRLMLPITHRELAQMVGVTAEHLSRLLHQLEDESLITRQRGWIIVRDLRQFAVTA